MNLVLDGLSAFDFWMSVSGTTDMHVVRAKNPQLTNFKGTSCTRLSERIASTGGKPGELQLLVREKSARRRAEGIVSYSWDQRFPIPQGSIIGIGPGLQTISPELCAVRLATMLPRLEYLRALTGLLSNYFLSIVDRTILIQRDPILTKEALLEYLDNCGPLPGSAIARRSLDWVVEHTASPREASMALMLALPTRLGGQNMPPFEANRPYSLDNDTAPLTKKKYLVADVAWHSRRRILEYNSDKYHDSETTRESDLEKITAFQRMGMTATPVSTRQFNDYDAFFSIVQGLRKEFGIRDRYAKSADSQRRRTHEELLATERRQRELPSINEMAVWQYLLPHVDSESPE